MEACEIMNLAKINNKIKDHMLIGSVYDNIIKKVKYNDKPLDFLYNVMVGQKHRMLYYKMLKKKYLNQCTEFREWETKEKKKNSNTIWICWLQGMNGAPILVKRCYESVKSQFPDKDIILLDETNFVQYVKMPDYIIDKWKSGIIAPAHFTDLLRLALLIERGGCWIDATVLCTDGNLLKNVENEQLFMFSFYFFGFNPEIMQLNNWFIYSYTNNNILSLIQKMLYTYWKENDRALDYFIFQIFTTIALEYYEEDYKKMPVVSQADSHILATYIFDEYNETKYKILKSGCGFHKLSTRFDDRQKSKKNTFYEVIIQQGKY